MPKGKTIPTTKVDCVVQRVSTAELIEALEDSLALNINWSEMADDEHLRHLSEYRRVIKKCTSVLERVSKMKSVDIWENADGTWTARIFSTTFSGSKSECESWLRNNGESI